ncbi:hypothetical protein G7068_14900 [Leucobacter viscericola]|uniref:Uncharacterized protein n=1 Tax=Leucobacter viscericola TaxID=2714935 RepID=A0A6G7XIZ9_9MICO|nr:hypothetical protein [Leucobacter viscericola]QIK64348.1 hypothetical protein G7068_14900 [Leucobacter viscericola]
METNKNSSGVWIVHGINKGEERIIAICDTPQEAEASIATLQDFFEDFRFAFFRRGYRFGEDSPSVFKGE